MQSLVERYSAADRQFDLVGMLTQLSPDALFKNYANSKRQPTLSRQQVFRQRRQTAEALQFGPAGARIHYQALLAQVLGGKAGDTLELSGRSEFRFDNGKISYLAGYNY